MVGRNELRCKGFLETDQWERSKQDLKQLLDLTDEQVDDRVGALLWALMRNPYELAAWRADVPD